MPAIFAFFIDHKYDDYKLSYKKTLPENVSIGVELLPLPPPYAFKPCALICCNMLQPSSAKCSNEESLIDAHELGHKRFKVKYGFLSHTHPMFIICSPMADFML